MKKILILLMILCVGGIGFSLDLDLSISGETTLEWGFSGSLINNIDVTGMAPFGDFFSGNGDDWPKTNEAPEAKLTLVVKNKDGIEVVKAATDEVDMPWAYDTAPGWSFDYIEFPNVVPGMLGILLDESATISTSVTTATSVSSNESVLVTVTPIEGLTVKLGVLVVPDYILTKTMLDLTVLDYDYFTTFAGSLEVGYEYALSAEDSIGITLGTVYDSAYGKAIKIGTDAVFTETWVDKVQSDTPVSSEQFVGWETLPIGVKLSASIGDLSANVTGETRLVTGKDVFDVTPAGALKPSYAIPMYAKVDAAYSIALGENKIATAKADEAAAVVVELKKAVFAASQAVGDAAVALEDSSSLDGLQAVVDAKEDLAIAQAAADAASSVDADSTVAADAATALTDAETALADLDPATLSATLDTAKETLAAAISRYEKAVSAAAKYEFDGPITITPNFNFQYCSDFWKWAPNTEVPPDDWEYKGEVSAAEFIGRPMSAGLGVDVDNIAGMFGVSLSGALGFGDGEYNHGLGFGALIPMPTSAFTLAAMLAEIKTLQGAVAGVNDNWFADNALVIKGSIGLTLEPIDGLTVGNTTSYTYDGLGYLGRDDAIIPPFDLYELYLNELKNTTNVDYDIIINESAAVTLFGELAYTNLSQAWELGTKYDQTAGTGVDAEITSISGLDYEIGVRVTVSF